MATSTARSPDTEDSVEKARKLLANVQKGANELSLLLNNDKSFFDTDFELRRSALQKGYTFSLQSCPPLIGEHIDNLVWLHAFYAVYQSLARRIDEQRIPKRSKESQPKSLSRLLETRMKMFLNSAIGFYEHAKFTVLRQLRNALDLKTKRILMQTLANSEEILGELSCTLADANSEELDTLLYSGIHDCLLEDRLASLARICVHLGDLHRYASVRGGQRHVHEAAARKLYRIAAVTWPHEAGSALAQLAVCSSLRVASSDVPIVMFLLLAMIAEKPPRNALENAKKRLLANRDRLIKERSTQRHASLSTFICTLFETVRKLVLFEPSLEELSVLCESTLNMFDELDRQETASLKRQRASRKLYGDVLFRLCVVVIAATNYTRRRASAESHESPPGDSLRYAQVTSALFLSFFVRLLKLALRYLSVVCNKEACDAAAQTAEKSLAKESESESASRKTAKKSRHGKSRLRRRTMFDDEDVLEGETLDGDVFEDSDELEEEESSESSSDTESESDAEECDVADDAECDAEATLANSRLTVHDCVQTAVSNRDCFYVLAALKLCCDQLRTHFDPACFAESPNSFAFHFRALVSRLPSHSDLIQFLRDQQSAIGAPNDAEDTDGVTVDLDLQTPGNNLLAEDLYTLSPLTLNCVNVIDRLNFADSLVQYFEYADLADLQCGLRLLHITHCFLWFSSSDRHKREDKQHDSVALDNESDNESRESQPANAPVSSDQESDDEAQANCSMTDDSVKLDKMRRLAELRLKAQVSELEQHVRSREAHRSQLLRTAQLTATRTVCAILDSSVLCEQLPLLKRVLQAARKRSNDSDSPKQQFLFVVPQTVIAHLDHMKSDDARSREASRFLEQQLYNNDSSLHLQQASETLRSAESASRRKEAEELRAELTVSCARYFVQLVHEFRKKVHEPDQSPSDSEAQSSLLQFGHQWVVILTGKSDVNSSCLSRYAATHEIPMQSVSEFARIHFRFA